MSLRTKIEQPEKAMNYNEYYEVLVQYPTCQAWIPATKLTYYEMKNNKLLAERQGNSSIGFKINSLDGKYHF